jgi:RIO kinase 1
LHDDAEYFQKRFDPLHSDRKARRKRKPRVAPQAKKGQREAVHEVADTTGMEGGFQPTYSPSKYEATWLISSLETFYDEDLIADILALVKGGKEASVYCCEATPSLGTDLVAAKVYRPRMFRQLRNDKMYQEGRQLLTGNGRPVKDRDRRLWRAVDKKTDFGAHVTHHSWLLHEFVTLKTLFSAGAAVPEPFAVGENAILMGYVGAEGMAAPPLSEIALDPEEAYALFTETLRNIDLMLAHGLIHGDLSAYNILYWEGAITLIDFPQVTAVQANSNARFILERDVQRVCEYFIKQGVECNPRQISEELWASFGKRRNLEEEIENSLDDSLDEQ